MKKIGVLTFFDADNYGALLQCYALTQFCKKKDNDVRVINYHSKNMFSWKYRLKRRFFKSKQNTRLDANRRLFFSVGNVNDKYDTVIVGSDQVWNPSIIKGDTFWIEPYISCDRLISYAASIGKSQLDNQELNFFKERDFSRYDWISVREKSGQNILKRVDVKSELVCDPTLLFYNQPQIYDNIVKNSRLIEQDFIFVYSLEKSLQIDEISRKLSSQYGYKVITAHPANNQTQYFNSFIYDSDICDFLYLIKNAKIVVTNSFHGLAFSYIFKKDVYVVCHSLLSSRQTDLLEISGVKYEKIELGVYHVNDYSDDVKMKRYVEKSGLFLENNL